MRTRSPTNTTQDAQDRDQRHNDHSSSSSDDDEEEVEAEEEDDSDDEDEEPRLKYAYLTKHLGSVYRNGDATSSFLVAGDKMVCILSGTYAI
jgi:TATA-binding protein-associated factor Taf7